MKNIFKSIMLFALIGLSAQSYSQVILNGGSFEALMLQGNNTPYVVPDGKIYIVTQIDSGFEFLFEGETGCWCGTENEGLVHIPLPSGTEITYIGSGEIAGYLIDVDEWGVTSDVPDEEIIDNDGGGIEIYPNPTGDLASVFVDYPGDWKMTVYDINGQIVLETQSETPVKSIDTNALSAGTYIVSVRAKRKLIGSSQLIVQ
tara:strand:- start:70 stop:675 length:606 start_codon:yes stop_codon:yes gene_type:complete